MDRTLLFSTALTVTLALYAPSAQAQAVLDEAPERPTPIIPDETINGIGSVDPETDIVVEPGTLVLASPGTYSLDPNFEAGLILEAGSSSITVAEGAQVAAPTFASIGVVSLFATDNAITIAGDVISDGDFGGGIFVFFADAHTVDVAETGVVFASGFQSAGITAFGSGESINIDGRVQTQGLQASGVLVGAGTDISVNVGATGQVLAEGDFSPALSTLLNPFESDIRFTNAGLVQSFGNAGSGATLATPGASIVNTGMIASVGDGANGIFAAQSNHTITNSGTVTALGGTFDTTIEEFVGLASPGLGATPVLLSATAILVGNGGVDISNTGTILSAQGPAILTSAELAAFTNAQGFGAGDVSLPITIFNSETGVIDGDTVAIQGSALIEHIDNSGTIIGDVLLDDGDDSFTLSLASGSVHGMIDGGDGNDSLTLSGRGRFHGSGQSGFENLTLTGGGRQRLFGDFGTFESLLVTTGNALFLNDRIDIDVTGVANFESGTVFSGSGRFSGDVITAGAVLPGGRNSVGELAIGGDYTQSSQSVLAIDIRNRRGNLSADLLSVGGTATLDGTLFVFPTARGRLSYGDKFTIVEAGKVTGAFGNVVTQSRSPVLYFEQVVDDTSVAIEVRARSIADILGPKSFLASVGKTLDALRFGGDYANFSGLFAVVDGAGVDNFGATLTGLTPISSFVHAERSNNFAQRFAGQIAERTLTLRGAGGAAAGFSGHGGAFLAEVGATTQEAGKFGVFGSVSGSFLAPASERATGQRAFEEAAFSEAGELTIGADLKLGDTVSVGLAVSNVRDGAYGGLGGQQADSNESRSTAAYAAIGFGKGFADMYVGFADQRFGLENSGPDLVDDQLRGAAGIANGDQTIAGARVGAALVPTKGLMIGPVASLDYVRSDLGGYRQALDGGVSLNVRERSSTSIGAKLGLMGALDVDVGRTGKLTAFGSVAYARQLGDLEDTVTASFVGAEGLPFSISRYVEPDWVAVNAGAELRLSRNISTKLSVSTDMGRGELSNHTGQVQLSWSF